MISSIANAVQEVKTFSVSFLIWIVIINSVSCDVHKGLYSNLIHDGKMVQPTKIHFNGEVSHNLTTYHDEHKGPLLINITIVNRLGLLVLEPITKFFANGAVIERHKSDILSRSKLRAESTKCHYHGSIKGDLASRVAVSTCNGLAGMIHSKHGKFWIEPLHHHDRKVGPYHKHIIYKRSTVIYHRDNKKRRKRHKRPRNCGTREHPRVTQLEWERRVGNVAVQEKKPKVRMQNKQRPKKLPSKKRSVRSVSTPRYVETLVVADQSMVEFHEDDNIDTYLLTIMNMVSSLYLDPSIGNLINIVVVKIILLDDPLIELTSNEHLKADVTLKNFCKWQSNLNYQYESDTHHYDVAILITRRGMCSHHKMPCNTLGVAHIGGMCDLKKSCSVNEDSGMSLAHTIAHELGHNFGMYHDTEKIGCTSKEGDIGHVMTPSFEADSVGVVWSKCSRRDLTNFLDKGLGTCLENNPHKNNDYEYPQLPAGAMYNADMQCWLQFGIESKVCAVPDEMCSRLWCEINGTCVTRMHPAAPGTQCGKHKWCQNQQCVIIKDPPIPVDGGWGEWSGWSECSRTCGAGISVMQRECDHPEPTAGGHFCLGERKRYRICNTDPCPINQPSFRTVQCTSFNNHTLNGKTYTWYPFFDKDEPCQLYCSDENNTMIIPWGVHAVDGTPCNIGKADMCISGICRKVGCDWVVDSNAEEDECGVCKGNSTGCDRLQGVFIEQSTEDGYKIIASIPIGARNITIEEVEATDNFLAIGSVFGGNFYLNGARQIMVGGEYAISGSQALYERKNGLEKVTIPGPLTEPIALYVIFQGNVYNPGVKYQYTLPKHQKKTVKHTWILSDWSQCSSTCGGGTQVQKPLCQESVSEISDGTAYAVDESSCDLSQRPQQLLRSCSEEPCHTSWWIGPWQTCPVTCTYKGVKAMRKRTIMCADEKQMALPDLYCSNSTKPKEYDFCKGLPLCMED